MDNYFNFTNFELKYYCGGPLKTYLHEYLTHEYIHIQKFPDLQHLNYHVDILFVMAFILVGGLMPGGNLLVCL